ncbi:hypothetical protein HGRIS_014905 [Hohenbuehelia grisea]|uniref:Uncharacterized protein n=1 Tax=Hohenbuehelia grisea TaxID=104357 RepID=A0ABR3JPL0_9AGAR
MPDGILRLALRNLRSIIMFPGTNDAQDMTLSRVKFYHESVRDFMGEAQRAGVFHVGESQGFDFVNQLFVEYVRHSKPMDVKTDHDLMYVIRHRIVHSPNDVYRFPQSIIGRIDTQFIRNALFALSISERRLISSSLDVPVWFFCHIIFAIYDPDEPSDLVDQMVRELQ